MIFKPLASITKIVAGQSPDSSTYNSIGEGLPFFQGKADFQDMHPKVRIWCTSKKRKEAEPGDILISVRAPVGAVNICNQKSIIGRGLSAIRPSSELDRKFLYYWLKANEQRIDALGTGSTFKAITQDMLRKIEIPVPLVDDQIRIAYLLGKVEGLIGQRKQHLQQLDDLLKSVFLEMFGDPVQNDKGWDTKTLPQLVQSGKNSLKRGPFGGALKKEIFVETGYLVYEQNHALNNDYSFARYFVTEDKYRELIDFKVVPGDVLISCSGVYLGKLSIVPADALPGIINQALLKVSLDPTKIERLFFVHVFGSPQFKEKYFPSNRGGAIPNLPPMSVMKEIPFIYPPINLQQEFTKIYEKVDVLKLHYKQSLMDLEALYGALSQQAFKGELDLSRVPLLGIQAEEENTVATESLQPPEEQAQTIHLPDTDNLLDSIKSPDGRQLLISHWLEAYRSQLGHVPFSVQDFIAAAQTRLAELHPENDFEFGASDYEHIKEWVFKALATGMLTQEIDSEKNQIFLKARPAEWGSW